MANKGHRDLIVYQKAFEVAMMIFKLSKNFPKEETYSLTDQIRRSSRSVCSNIAEAYRKRNYTAYFQNKISDADAENSETMTWLDFALACEYLDKESFSDLVKRNEEIGRILDSMIRNPEKFKPKSNA
ncbi:MAG: four helix bundle protein [Bacteroidota bacterium]